MYCDDFVYWLLHYNSLAYLSVIGRDLWLISVCIYDWSIFMTDVLSTHSHDPC